jgi:hypothetical protein
MILLWLLLFTYYGYVGSWIFAEKYMDKTTTTLSTKTILLSLIPLQLWVMSFKGFFK